MSRIRVEATTTEGRRSFEVDLGDRFGMACQELGDGVGDQGQLSDFYHELL